VQNEVAKAAWASAVFGADAAPAATSPLERPFANNQIVWKCRDEITSSHAS